MSTETNSVRKQLVGMSKEAAWDLLIKRIDDLAARVEELEWEVHK